MEPTRLIVEGKHGESHGEEVLIEALTKDQRRSLVWKTDLVVMPLAIICMTIAFLDKVSLFSRFLSVSFIDIFINQNALGYAAILGIKEDANLKNQEYSWLGSIFYLGYLAMEFPTLWLITRFPVGRYVGICLTLWGVCLCLLAICHNFAGLAAIRFILGVLEAATLPSMMLINAMWYLSDEQPLRTALWHNTFAGVFGGILSYGIGKIEGSLSTWKVRLSFQLIRRSS